MLFDDPVGTEIQRWLARPAPSLLVVEGGRELGRRHRVGAAMRSGDGSVRWLRPHPGGDPASRVAFARDLVPAAGQDVDPERAPPWDEVWSDWSRYAAATPDTTWVIDDADALPPAAWDALRATWAGVRAQALGVRVLLLASSASAVRLGEVPHERMPITRRPPIGWLRGESPWSTVDRIRAAAIFGGDPTLVDAIDPSRSLGRNVRTLLLAPGAPLATRPVDRLRTAVQRPERYLRVLEAIARGARDWGSIRDRVGGLSSSGQLGPYLKTLETEGWVDATRSLDAAPASRSARYRISDLHTAFWFSGVLPAWSRLGVDDPRRIWREVVRPGIDAHVARVLPRLVASWLRSGGGRDTFGARARETGALWGERHDIEVAATLETGAIVYGWTRWDDEGFTVPDVAARRDQLRGTRYGFGRENRIRLLVQRPVPGHGLGRLAARDEGLVVLSAEDLLHP